VNIIALWQKRGLNFGMHGNNNNWGLQNKKLDLQLSNCSTNEKGKNSQPTTPIGHAINRASLSN